MKKKEHEHKWKSEDGKTFKCKCGVKGKRVDYGKMFYIEEIHYDN
jgi:hypothetical protein